MISNKNTLIKHKEFTSLFVFNTGHKKTSYFLVPSNQTDMTSILMDCIRFFYPKNNTIQDFLRIKITKIILPKEVDQLGN